MDDKTIVFTFKAGDSTVSASTSPMTSTFTGLLDFCTVCGEMLTSDTCPKCGHKRGVL